MSETPRHATGTDAGNFSIAVFPFLKTSGPAVLGGMTFRSTDDTDGLPADQARAVRDVAAMLFLQGDYRIRSASYAVVPRIDTNDPGQQLDALARAQAVVAYWYAGPRHETGNLFLSSEHASLSLFTPGPVIASLARPNHHVDAVNDAPTVDPNVGGTIEGFSGIYNFRHHFWAARGSRLYGPLPQLTLNISQDLRFDLDRARTGRADYRGLHELLHHPDGAVAKRVFAALRWFNAANSESSDEASELVDLSIAFETLLQLPKDEKTSRLADAVSLLLGRTARLEAWVQQFYDARSRVAHEGRADQLHFVARRNGDKSKDATYQTLISYGRVVFQLCLGTILAGARLAERARLEEKFVTNQERFEQACKLLGDSTLGPDVRLDRLSALATAIQEYRFVPESGLRAEAMLGACRNAARCWLDCDPGLLSDARERLEKLAGAARNDDHFHAMEALAHVSDLMRDGHLRAETDGTRAARDLIDAVWMYVFQHYFWLKQRRERDVGPPAPSTT